MLDRGNLRKALQFAGVSPRDYRLASGRLRVYKWFTRSKQLCRVPQGASPDGWLGNLNMLRLAGIYIMNTLDIVATFPANSVRI